MIIKTDEYKFIEETLSYSKGTLVTKQFIERNHGISPDKYPHLLQVIYKLEDGSRVCLGEQIWRSKKYEVKSTTFSLIHISQNTPIFGTREGCEKWLETNANNIKTELLKQNSDGFFQTLKSLVYKLDALETLSHNDIAILREGMKNCISNIESI